MSRSATLRSRSCVRATSATSYARGASDARARRTLRKVELERLREIIFDGLANGEDVILVFPGPGLAALDHLIAKVRHLRKVEKRVGELEDDVEKLEKKEQPS